MSVESVDKQELKDMEIPLDLTDTNLHRQIVRDICIVVAVLKKHGYLQLNQLKEEALLQGGADLGKDPTGRLKRMMHICSGIKRIHHGVYTYEEPGAQQSSHSRSQFVPRRLHMRTRRVIDTIRAILQKHRAPIHFSRLRQELEEQGFYLTKNGTYLMEKAMDVYPQIQRADYGVYVYQKEDGQTK